MLSQKSYNSTPTLYLIPTPIGNMGDFTYRGVDTLKSVDVIFCEDTRVAINLLNHFGIKKTLLSAHKFNEEKIVLKMLDFLNNEKSIALISDRGTPLISDPGSSCTKKIIENGYNVVSLPGATALIPALTSSGLPTDKFLFYGFLDSKSSKRREELEGLKLLKYSIIFYEAPHRIIEMLAELKDIFGDREVSISREISKKFEEVYRGSLSNIIEEIKTPKGEFVIVVSGNKGSTNFESITIAEHFKFYINQGFNEKEAMKEVAKDRGISKSEIYKTIKGKEEKWNW